MIFISLIRIFHVWGFEFVSVFVMLSSNRQFYGTLYIYIMARMSFIVINTSFLVGLILSIFAGLFLMSLVKVSYTSAACGINFL